MQLANHVAAAQHIQHIQVQVREFSQIGLQRKSLNPSALEDLSICKSLNKLLISFYYRT